MRTSPLLFSFPISGPIFAMWWFVLQATNAFFYFYFECDRPWLSLLHFSRLHCFLATLQFIFVAALFQSCTLLQRAMSGIIGRVKYHDRGHLQIQIDICKKKQLNYSVIRESQVSGSNMLPKQNTVLIKTQLETFLYSKGKVRGKA